MSKPGNGWNPKRVGIKKSNQHEAVMWLYLIGRTLEIVVQVSHQGIVLGTTTHTVRLPREKSNAAVHGADGGTGMKRKTYGEHTRLTVVEWVFCSLILGCFGVVIGWLLRYQP